MNESRAFVPSGETSIPVNYVIEGTGNRRTVSCVVDLPANELPQWLTVTNYRFEISKHGTVTRWHIVPTEYKDLQNAHLICDTLDHVRVHMIHYGLTPQ